MLVQPTGRKPFRKDADELARFTWIAVGVGRTARVSDDVVAQRGTNVTSLLTGDPQRMVEVKIANEKGEERTVSMRPTNFPGVRRAYTDIVK